MAVEFSQAKRWLGGSGELRVKSPHLWWLQCWMHVDVSCPNDKSNKSTTTNGQENQKHLRTAPQLQKCRKPAASPFGPASGLG